MHMGFYQAILVNIDIVQQRAGTWLNSNLPENTYIAGLHTVSPVNMYPPFHMAGHRFLAQKESVPDWLVKLNKEKPQYYISVFADQAGQYPEFLKLYKKEVSFENKTSLDKLFTNHLLPKLTRPITVYTLRNLS